jgi:hypothetical protein
MPAFGASLCGANGFLVILGDPSVDVPVATGTFTGPLVTNTMVVPTSAGLGTDTLKGYFIEVTSGASTGFRNTILGNTDASITIASRLGGFTVASTDAFRVYAPGTVLDCPAAASGQPSPGCSDWQGTRSFQTATPCTSRHIFFNLQLTGTSLAIQRSNVGFTGVRSALTSSFLVTDRALCWLGAITNSFFLGIGTDTATFRLTGCGFTSTGACGFLVSQGSTCFATTYWVGTFTIGSASNSDEVFVCGFRCSNQVGISRGRFETFGSGILIMDKTTGGGGCFLLMSGQLHLVGTAPCVFSQTSGHCIHLTQNAQVVLDNSGGLITGTAPAGSFALKLLQGGGRVITIGALALTGGTPGLDINTTNLTKASTFLAAAGDVISDVGGAEIVVRG